MTNQELITLNNVCHGILESNLSWEEKYKLIFSKEISRTVQLNYYDPDISYENDVCAWVEAFDEFILKYTHIKK